MRIVCFSWTNKELNIINMNGATTNTNLKICVLMCSRDDSITHLKLFRNEIFYFIKRMLWITYDDLGRKNNAQGKITIKRTSQNTI